MKTSVYLIKRKDKSVIYLFFLKKENVHHQQRNLLVVLSSIMKQIPHKRVEPFGFG